MIIERLRGLLPLGPTSSGQPNVDDRRVTHRRAVFLRATIYPVDVFCIARIRDVSATGLRGEANVELAIGQTIHLTIDEHNYHAGVVKWVRDREFGLDIVNANKIFGCKSTYMDHGDREGHQPRAPRSKINMTARFVMGRPPRPAIVRNLSAGGMLLETGPGLKTGQHLVVRVSNSPPIYGRAQWTGESQIGFKAEHTISVLSIICSVD